MIALPSSLPLLRVGRYELTTYGPEWVEDSIKDAARRAGHNEWWLACDITRSLMPVSYTHLTLPTNREV